MVVSGMLATAWSYATGAYAYNLNRFQFDAGQQQASVHQRQNLRIAEWGVFREDVRDLFQLTTTNMSTYMIVSTLFFSLAGSIFYVVCRDFPSNPIWLMAIFGNSLLASLAYSLLSIWLSMHGCIAAHSALVKVLTQAIRLPIPSAAEMDEVRQRQDNYEGSGPGRFLQLPAFVPGTRQGGGSPGEPNLGEAAQSETNASEHQRAAAAQELAAELLKDEDGGPGRGAAFDSHIRLFRQMHLTYACFDAYARISLSAAVHEMLLALGFLSLGHNMCKFSPDGQPLQNRFFAWATILTVTFTTVTVFKLDLYVDKSRMRIIKQAAFAGPIIAGLASNLWVSSRTPGELTLPDGVPDGFVMLASVMHVIWLFLLMWEARPEEGEFKLPMSWRSVRYLDIFGWMEDVDGGNQRHTQNSDNADADMDPEELQRQKRHWRVAMRKAISLLQVVDNLIDGEGSTALQPIDLEVLQTVQHDLNEVISAQVVENSTCDRPSVGSSGTASSIASLADLSSAWWLECLHTDGYGQTVPYFVHSMTGEISWYRPEDGRVMQLQTIADRVRSLQDQTTLRSASASSSGTDVEMRVLRQGGQPGTDGQGGHGEGPSNVDQSVLAEEREDVDAFLGRGRLGDEPVPFEPMARRPGSSHDVASMPWKYFAQLTKFFAALWILLIIWLAVHFFAANPHANTPTISAISDISGGVSADADIRAAIAPFSWPHKHFRPSALTCSADFLVLADTFELYVADREAWSERPVQLRPLHLADRSIAWTALSMDENLLVLLEREGRSVSTCTIEGAAGSNAHCSDVRRWPLSPRIGALSSIFVRVRGGLCGKPNQTASLDHEMAIYGMEDRGRVVLLCPSMNGLLEPLYTVAAVPERSRASGEVFGLHIEEQVLWLQTRDAQADRAELHAWAKDGSSRGAWRLPLDRRWAPGLCAPLTGGFLVAGEVAASVAAAPEVWSLLGSAAPTCSDCSSSINDARPSTAGSTGSLRASVA
eukprot:TRINITY_DN457_c1_g2_i1.p1 TRINITY_DN457_c1_g2~~TRINITY_DN457_c1_g2_i1.p1  ORF type:complete len:990 (-),score=191.47 TRINITY_DN457_c1_g2_i1:148-3117(-)